MTVEDVLALLEANRDERGIRHFEKPPIAAKLKSYGIGLTKLKALAKKIGKDAALAKELWKQSYYEALVISILIDDPKQLTEERVEQQLSKVESWMLSYIYCSTLLSKTKYLRDLAVKWIATDDELHKRCGYQLLYQVAQSDKKLEDSFFLPYVETIESELQSQENFVRDAMNNALWRIGQRSKALNQRCIAAAKKIGKVEVDYGDNSCQPADALKHLTSDRVRRQLGLA